MLNGTLVRRCYMMKKFSIFHCTNTTLGRLKESFRTSLTNAREKKLITGSGRAANSDSDHIFSILERLLLAAQKEVNILYQDFRSTGYH